MKTNLVRVREKDSLPRSSGGPKGAYGSMDDLRGRDEKDSNDDGIRTVPRNPTHRNHETRSASERKSERKSERGSNANGTVSDRGARGWTLVSDRKANRPFQLRTTRLRNSRLFRCLSVGLLLAGVAALVALLTGGSSRGFRHRRNSSAHSGASSDSESNSNSISNSNFDSNANSNSNSNSRSVPPPSALEDSLSLLRAEKNILTSCPVPYTDTDMLVPECYQYGVFVRDRNDNIISPWHDIPTTRQQRNAEPQNADDNDNDNNDAPIPLYNFVVEIPKLTRAKLRCQTTEKHTPIRHDLVLPEGDAKASASAMPSEAAAAAATNNYYYWNSNNNNNNNNNNWNSGGERLLRYFPGPIYWNYGFLPQTWASPLRNWNENENENDDENRNKDDDDDNWLRMSGQTELVGDGNPLNVIELGSTVLPTGTTKPLKVLGALPLLVRDATKQESGGTTSASASAGANDKDKDNAPEVVVVDWKIVGIAADDPLADQWNDVSDLPVSITSGIREWFRWVPMLEAHRAGTNDGSSSGSSSGSGNSDGNGSYDDHHHLNTFANREDYFDATTTRERIIATAQKDYQDLVSGRLSQQRRQESPQPSSKHRRKQLSSAWTDYTRKYWIPPSVQTTTSTPESSSSVSTRTTASSSKHPS